MLYSFFPKTLADLSVTQLAQFAKDAGLDACNAVIRDGYWTTTENLADTFPSFVSQLRDAGIEVPVTETDWDPDQALSDASFERHLDTIQSAGVNDIRLRQLNSGGRFGGVGDVVAELEQAARSLARLADLAEKRDCRFIYQVHHKTLLASPSSLYPLVKDLDPKRMGVMLDAGNQLIEGFENWLRSCRLFRDHLAAFGVKDTAFYRNPDASPEDPAKGWSFKFVPCNEGLANWREIGAALRDVHFDGPLVFMPFYPDSKSPDTLLPTLRQEVAYVRKALSANPS